MSAELSAKVQVALWWITSIAVSVLCCSIIFVLFASYFVDVKAAVKESSDRINIIEDREDTILLELDMIRKHAVFQPAQPAAAAVQAPAADAPANLTVSGPNPDKALAPSDASAPQTSAPQAAAPQTTAPKAAAPTLPTPADKK